MHRTWIAGTASAIALIVALPLAQLKAEPRPGLAVTLTETVIVPRAERLDDSMKAQANAWTAACDSPDKLKSAYAAAADAWAATEHMRFGPLSKQNRAERISFWPDPRNAIGRGLETLRTAPDEAALAPDRLANASVAVQGLPIIERLLYPATEPGEEAESRLDVRTCAIGKAVAQNLAAIAAGVAAEWRAPEVGELARLRLDAAAPDKARGDAALMLTDLATLFQVIEDRKLPPLVGAGSKAPNPRAAEAWRSGRSSRNIALNLEAAEQTLAMLRTDAPTLVDDATVKLRQARDELASKPDAPPSFAVTSAINNVRYIVTEQLPGALGIALGFNSLDGD